MFLFPSTAQLPRVYRPLMALLCLVLALTLASPATAEEIATQTLHYRSAEQVVSRLQQVFPQDEVRISGLRNQIIIRARDTSTLRQVQDLIAQIDTRPRQFRITLRRQGESDRQVREIGAGGTLGNENSRVRITTRHGAFSNQGQSQQMVTVLEDNAVAIQQGQLRPVRDIWVSRQGVATSTQYQSVGDALVVTPRAVGDNQVELSVHASHSRPSQNRSEQLDQIELVTQRIVGYGSWVELGSVSDNQRERQDGVTHYSTRQERSLGRYEIKVELIE